MVLRQQLSAPPGWWSDARRPRLAPAAAARPSAAASLAFVSSGVNCVRRHLRRDVEIRDRCRCRSGPPLGRRSSRHRVGARAATRRRCASRRSQPRCGKSGRRPKKQSRQCYIVILFSWQPGYSAIGPSRMSHDNMSRKRLGRNRANHVQSTRFGQSGSMTQPSAVEQYLVKDPGTLRAEPGAHGRAGRQGRLRLGRAARKGRGARQRRRTGRRHGQDLLQAHRILACPTRSARWKRRRGCSPAT